MTARRSAHGYLQSALGALVDEDYGRCDRLIWAAIDRVKDIEVERDALAARVEPLRTTLEVIRTGWPPDSPSMLARAALHADDEAAS